MPRQFTVYGPDDEERMSWTTDKAAARDFAERIGGYVLDEKYNVAYEFRSDQVIHRVRP